MLLTQRLVNVANIPDCSFNCSRKSYKVIFYPSIKKDQVTKQLFFEQVRSLLINKVECLFQCRPFVILIEKMAESAEFSSSIIFKTCYKSKKVENLFDKRYFGSCENDYIFDLRPISNSSSISSVINLEHLPFSVSYIFPII